MTFNSKGWLALSEGVLPIHSKSTIAETDCCDEYSEEEDVSDGYFSDDDDDLLILPVSTGEIIDIEEEGSPKEQPVCTLQGGMCIKQDQQFKCTLTFLEVNKPKLKHKIEKPKPDPKTLITDLDPDDESLVTKKVSLRVLLVLYFQVPPPPTPYLSPSWR